MLDAIKFHQRGGCNHGRSGRQAEVHQVRRRTKRLIVSDKNYDKYNLNLVWDHSSTN